MSDTFDGFSKIPDFLKKNYDNGTFKLNSLLPHLGDLSASFIVIDFLEDGINENIKEGYYGPAAVGLMEKFRDNLNKLGYVSGEDQTQDVITNDTVETSRATQGDANTLMLSNPE